MPTPMRQAIARHMTYSKQNIPHYYLSMRPEISAVLAAREAWNAGRAKEDTVSINDVMVKATALALQQHPHFNAFYQHDEVQPQARINIGVAIALPDGLVAPALLDCQTLSLADIARRSRDLAARARQGSLRAEEYTAATFTITNLGMYHVDSFQAIIVPPQVGILAIGGVTEQPCWRNDTVMAGHFVVLTLSGDHRATDGAQGALFMGELVSCLQNPTSLFV